MAAEEHMVQEAQMNGIPRSSAALAQRVTFELALGQQIEPNPKVTIRPKYGIKMVVRRRPLP